MWENTIELLKKKGVIVDKGLSDAEIGQIEQLYKIRVPQILQDLWKEGYPYLNHFIIGEILPPAISAKSNRNGQAVHV